jgi:CheY-like chemotaxis protein
VAKILIIDDSQVIRDLLTDLLSDLGHVVILAVDGGEGLSIAMGQDFDVCICDLHIPKKNGYEVFREVSEAKPTLPFIMTDSLPDHLAEMATTAGAPYCLKKPFDLDQLRSVLDELLKPVKAQ